MLRRIMSAMLGPVFAAVCLMMAVNSRSKASGYAVAFTRGTYALTVESQAQRLDCPARPVRSGKAGWKPALRTVRSSGLKSRGLEAKLRLWLTGYDAGRHPST